MHLEHVVAVAEPFIRGLLHRCRRRGLHPFQVVLVAIGIARVRSGSAPASRSCRRSRRSVPRSARMCRESASSPIAIRRRVGPFFRKFCSSSLAAVSTLLEVFTRIRGEREIELPADFVGIVRRGRAGRNLIFVDQPLVEPRGLALPKHLCRQVEQAPLRASQILARSKSDRGEPAGRDPAPNRDACRCVSQSTLPVSRSAGQRECRRSTFQLSRAPLPA